MVKSKEPKPKHVPMRTSIATGKKLPKKEMIRLVRIEDHNSTEINVEVDAKGQLRGRGANIEMDIDSFDLAVNKGAIERALKLNSKLSSERIKQLRADFQEAIDERNFRVGNQKVSFKISKQEMENRLSK